MAGIGASAGGLHALEAFFSQIPDATGIAFVVVTHQDAHRKSLLPELLARFARLPVHEIKDKQRIEPDHIYVAPPGANVELVKATFRVSPTE